MHNRYRLEWLKRIYPEFKESKWNYDNVLRINEIPYFDFYKGSISYKAKINPQNIIGIDYAWEYNAMRDITWVKLLSSLKRFDDIIKLNKTKEQVINHIHYAHSEAKCVSKFGDQYITTQGQHRLCTAKFLDIEFVEVFVTEYIFDKERFDRFNNLKENSTKLIELGLFNSCTDLFVWSEHKHIFIEINKQSIYIEQYLLKDFILYFDNFKIIRGLSFIQRAIFNILDLSSESYYNLRLKNKSDFRLLKSLIVDHKVTNKQFD